MKYRFIDGQRGTHSVGKMAEMLGVSRSGYYAWRGRPRSRRERRDEELAEAIEKIQERVKYRYGSPRITKELRRRGERVGHNHVARLMALKGLGARLRRRYRSTTNSSHALAVCENLLGRRFDVAEPDTAWVSDMTYVSTAEGWLYLCVVLDLASRKVVGWSLGRRMKTGLMIEALMMAVVNRRPKKGVMFHSDRGSQYCSATFRRRLRRHGFVQSMSGKGDCWDNAPAESFFKTLKSELWGHRAFPTREMARAAIFEYIEVFYNRRRLHSGLDYVTPTEYEAAMELKQAS